VKSLSALIVDDSPVMRKIIGTSLRYAGILVENLYEAADGAEALKVLKNSPVDLILSDINMPGMNGLDFVRELQRERRIEGLTVVMVTNEASQEQVVQALRCGVKAYIHKPFTPERLREELAGLLEE
jgi:two-component system chemotaxis response regulator CheY